MSSSRIFIINLILLFLISSVNAIAGESCSNKKNIWGNIKEIANPMLLMSPAVTAIVGSQCNLIFKFNKKKITSCYTSSLAITKNSGLNMNLKGELGYFTKELKEMMSDPEIGQFLKDLSNALKNDKASQLWRWTLNHPLFKGKPNKKEEAIKTLAVLFSGNGSEIERYSKDFINSNGPHLKDAYDELWNGIKRDKVQPYPPPIKSKDTSIYHFYAISYLTQKIIKKGTPKDIAVVVAGSLNQVYEQYTGDLVRLARWDSRVNENTYEDIFTGYAGALFATHDSPFSRGIDKASFINQVKFNGGGVALKGLLKNNFSEH